MVSVEKIDALEEAIKEIEGVFGQLGNDRNTNAIHTLLLLRLSDLRAKYTAEFDAEMALLEASHGDHSRLRVV